MPPPTNDFLEKASGLLRNQKAESLKTTEAGVVAWKELFQLNIVKTLILAELSYSITLVQTKSLKAQTMKKVRNDQLWSWSSIK